MLEREWNRKDGQQSGVNIKMLTRETDDYVTLTVRFDLVLTYFISEISMFLALIDLFYAATLNIHFM